MGNKKDRIVRKKYIELYEQPKTFSPTFVDYLNGKNDYERKISICGKYYIDDKSWYDYIYD